MISQTQIDQARALWSGGYMRKEISRRTKLSERAVSRVCSDLPKPYEHRGRKSVFVPHREDFEIE